MAQKYQILAGHGLAVRDHYVSAPASWDDPQRFGSIQVFAREVVDPSRRHDELPILLYLQGGPGGMSPRLGNAAWLKVATSTHRVVLLDQRGTGRSHPISAQTAAEFPSPQVFAEFLRGFRADAIVRDAELLRTTIFGGKQWESLGQSYGGFITLTYLSHFPQGLRACYITGGLPWIGADAAQVYAHTFPRQLAANQRFAQQFPDDVVLLEALSALAQAEAITLPSGDQLTRERIQQLGQGFGMSYGFNDLHWLLDTAFTDRPALLQAPEKLTARHILPGFLHQLESLTNFASNPLYMLFQETIYHQGHWEGWAAAEQYRRTPEFAAEHAPLQLTGEAVFPWMYEQISTLRPFRGVAEELAGPHDWAPLYDAERLAANEVPIAAVQYVDDTYVDLALAQKTAEHVGNNRVWITNEFLHDGLRSAPERILPRLLALAAGK